ncbi:MAG: hypothetical protein US95_C0024G0003 [Candidatus Woesebacteria bacterium GW2011_GWB1_38_5]|uniref:Uncharacterized protein n=1 Tax=Candidatus Woesebacteria bacterium GW2011_GWB1_38_5 TaxID=1618568 RepID=A0A0G0KG42_9BACT|nr:MAG: hypothetical protein US95_C0024G0003 [Candidatus Woesebacteria bacterium GW2011_GWB1_38_5]
MNFVIMSKANSTLPKNIDIIRRSKSLKFNLNLDLPIQIIPIRERGILRRKP